MEDKTLKLELTVSEINEILDALAKQPFGQVYELISKIQAQATPQLGEQQVQVKLTTE